MNRRCLATLFLLSSATICCGEDEPSSTGPRSPAPTAEQAAEQWMQAVKANDWAKALPLMTAESEEFLVTTHAAAGMVPRSPVAGQLDLSEFGDADRLEPVLQASITARKKPDHKMCKRVSSLVSDRAGLIAKVKELTRRTEHRDWQVALMESPELPDDLLIVHKDDPTTHTDGFDAVVEVPFKLQSGRWRYMSVGLIETKEGWLVDHSRRARIGPKN